MTKARQIMVADVCSVTEDIPIYLAMGVLVAKRVSGLPVVDSNNKLVGIITEKDMLKLVDNELVAEGQTVADYMVHNVAAFGVDDDIEVIKKVLLDKPFRRVPIVNRKGELAGVISRHDIISYFLERRDPDNFSKSDESTGAE